MSQQQIHWFPGHMKKAQIEIEKKVKLVDCVIELLDARIPLASRNETLSKIVQNKLRLVVLTKADLADEVQTKNWEIYFKNEGSAVIFADLNKSSDIQNIIKNVEKLGEAKQQKLISKGMKPQPIRAMVIGIPNVGKSTLINKLAKRHSASVQNKPGHTKSQQLIKVSNRFELLDTPGILQNSYDDKNKAMLLALTGSIKREILPTEEVAEVAYKYLYEYYFANLKERFSYIEKGDSSHDAFVKIARSRGYLAKGLEDINKAMEVFLNELKNGQIGRVSFERANQKWA